MERDAQTTGDPAAQGGWQYHADSANGVGQSAQSPVKRGGEGAVGWTASEYIAHHKGWLWYVTLAFGAIASAVLVYLFTREYLSAGVIIFVAILFGVAAGRKPRVLEYELNDKGLIISEKFYPYTDFKSFTVAAENAFTSVNLLPLKRFMPSLTIYLPPEEQKRILDVLSGHLPLEQHTPEMVERFLRRVRF